MDEKTRMEIRQIKELVNRHYNYLKAIKGEVPLDRFSKIYITTLFETEEEILRQYPEYLNTIFAIEAKRVLGF